MLETKRLILRAWQPKELRCKDGISYRDLEEMMQERCLSIDHTTLYRWVMRYAPEIHKCLA